MIDAIAISNMGMRTRSATSSPVKPAAGVPASKCKSTALEQQDPLKLLVVPDDLTEDARILSLRHPRDQTTARFLFCPSKGLFEFTRVAAPALDHRSILFARDENESSEETAFSKTALSAVSDGFINKDAEFLIATPFDVCFILLSLLPSSLSSDTKTLYQPLDDLLEPCMQADAHVRYMLQHGKKMVEAAAEKICDTIDAGDEKMVRVNADKVFRLMWQKAEAVVDKGLPASLEEKFVTRALEVPVVSVKREQSTVTATAELPLAGAENEDLQIERADSQSTIASSNASAVFSEISVASSTTTVVSEGPPSDIERLQCLRIAFQFILASYLPAKISSHLQERLRASKDPDFGPLDEQLKHIADLKAEAQASRSLGDFSRKRGNADDDEAAEERIEKKRRLDEEEKRKKANESRGVRDLKKVNVTGMKKMSSFFTKTVPVKAKT